MTYRSADGVLQSRLDDLERDLVELGAQETQATAECEASERTRDELDERLKVAGPGGAPRGPTFDRIGVLIIGLCIVGCLVIPAEIYIGGYVHRQPEETVVPILLLGGPGMLAAVIAWPYRRLSGYGAGAAIGVLLFLSAIVNIVAGVFRR